MAGTGMSDLQRRILEVIVEEPGISTHIILCRLDFATTRDAAIGALEELAIMGYTEFSFGWRATREGINAL